jgi:hypothetical protein
MTKKTIASPLISIMLLDFIGKNEWLRGTIFDIGEGFLIEDNRHLAEVTEAFLISRKKIGAAQRTMLVHRKHFVYTLKQRIQTG